MDSFARLISVRRSIRRFTPDRVADGDIELLMRAALMAPSGKGLHSYEFVVVTDSAMLGQLAAVKDAGGEFLAGAPLAVVVAGDPAVSDTWMEDCSLAAAHLMLQAEDLGLGSCWVQVRGRSDSAGHDAEDNVRQLLNIPSDRRVLCMVAIGYKGMERKPQNEDKLKWERVHRELY